jgi:hypothetical protein
MSPLFFQRGLAGFGGTVLIVTPARITAGVVSKGVAQIPGAAAVSRTVSSVTDGFFLEPPANPAALQITDAYLKSMQPANAPVPLVPVSPILPSGPPIFGNNANQNYHAFRHIVDEGMSPSTGQTAIKSNIAANAAALNVGSNTRSIMVDGRQITYNAHVLPNGITNVGRITVP